MKKNHLIILAVIGVILYFFLNDLNKDKVYLMCQTTTAHDKIMEGKKIKDNIPTKFNLFMDRPWDIFIYPRVGFKNEKNQMLKIFFLRVQFFLTI